MKARILRVAAVTGELEWSHRQETSGNRYDGRTARAYVQACVSRRVDLIRTAADRGASLVVAPEYFAGTEMFAVEGELQLQLVRETSPGVLDALAGAASELGIHIACSMNLAHHTEVVQTGVMVGPGEMDAVLQIKNTALPPGHPLAAGYRLMDLDGVSAGLFVCSDLTSYPEDPIRMAKAGMELILTPGCGFAGEHWMHYLKVRCLDLGVPVIYADDSRGAVVDHLGRTLACTERRGDVILTDLEIPRREPVDRLYSYVGRRFET